MDRSRDGRVGHPTGDPLLRAQWRVLAWWLARTYPEHYGPHAKSFDQQLDEYRAEQHSVGPDQPDMAALAERITASAQAGTLAAPIGLEPL
ncbi:hypothetical protein ACWGVR_40850 [Streptomyces xanthophaeus]